MNKNVLITAMSLAMLGGASLANAEVTLYGQLDLSVDYFDDGNNNDDWNMGSNRSSFGVKGAEDLGNGMSAFFKLEWQVDVDDADQPKSSFNEDETSGGFTGRDQYMGLMFERFGKLTFGTMSTAYKSDSSSLDPMYRTRIQQRNTGIQSVLHKGKGDQGQGRATNTVRYDSPSWNGFSGTVHYTLDNDKDAGNVDPGKTGEDDDPYGAGVRYKGGNLYAFASYVTNSQSGDGDAYQLGAKFNFLEAWAVWAMFEKDLGLISTQTWGTGNNGDGADIYHVGGSWSRGNNIISAAYAYGDDNEAKVSDGAGGTTKLNTEYQSYQISAQHKFSNRTKIYTGFSVLDCDGGNAGADVSTAFCKSDNDDKEKLFTVGMRHNF
jgi:predicted porin